MLFPISPYYFHIRSLLSLWYVWVSGTSKGPRNEEIRYPRRFGQDAFEFELNLLIGFESKSGFPEIRFEDKIKCYFLLFTGFQVFSLQNKKIFIFRLKSWFFFSNSSVIFYSLQQESSSQLCPSSKEYTVLFVRFHHVPFSSCQR